MELNLDIKRYHQSKKGEREKVENSKLRNQKIRQFIIHVQSDFWRLVMKIIILADVAKIIGLKNLKNTEIFSQFRISKIIKVDVFSEFARKIWKIPGEVFPQMI